MLERREAEDGFVSYHSPRLSAVGVPHLFTTRCGGTPLGELDVTLEEDAGLSRVRQELGLPTQALCALRQVHGSDVRHARAPHTPDAGNPGLAPPAPPREWQDGDALVCDDENALTVIRTADCVPVLMATMDGSLVAAAHAGWRGLVAGVLQNTVARFEGRGPVCAAIGPSISPEKFEVGEEVAQQFRDAGLGEAIVRRGSSRPHIDLWLAARRLLESAGVNAVDIGGLCTWENPDEFYSYRRDVTGSGLVRTGRLGAFISPFN